MKITQRCQSPGARGSSYRFFIVSLADMITLQVAVSVTESGGERGHEEKQFMWFLYCKLCCTGGVRCPMGKHFLEFPTGETLKSIRRMVRLVGGFLQSFPIGQRTSPVQESG
jgi:hypothetical protein